MKFAGTVILISGSLIFVLWPYFYRRSPEIRTGIEGENILDPVAVTRLFEKSEKLLSPKWNSSEKIMQMILAIQNSSADGLNPNDYYMSDIKNLSEKIIATDSPSTEDIRSLEDLLTDSFTLLASHLSTGKTDPDIIDPSWKVPRRKSGPDWKSFIDSTLESGRISETLRLLTPVQPDYVNLKKALINYKRLKENGGWEKLNTDQHKFEIGMRHQDVPLLRERLAAIQGEIDFDQEDENLFDQNLYDQVVIFQQRNGLEPDGVVGRSTIETLNISVDERIETIRANLERWRWISENLGESYIRVNIADFRLMIMENNSLAFGTPAIVGRQLRETPVFSSTLKYMILNPAWVVPPGILKEDVLPAIVKDSSYLKKHNMKVLNSNGIEVDPSTIDWKNAVENGFPYMIRQDPGQGNPLGRIKFIFPNSYNVYIHDTPSHGLFHRNTRTFSSGCIRVGNALELAEHLLKEDSEWTPEKLKQALDEGSTKTIILKNPVPVYVLYLTAWADEDGTAYFGKDIYHRDDQLISALGQSAPGRDQ